MCHWAGPIRKLPSFSVRDASDSMNVTLWMSNESEATEFDTGFHVGDVVQISNARIRHKDPDGGMYFPVVSSPFTMVYSSSHSKMTLLNKDVDHGDYLSFLCIPSKSLVSICRY